MHPPTFARIALLAGVLLTGCARSAADSSHVAVRDSAGITVVEHAPEALREVESWFLPAEPILQIGQLTGEDVYLFNRIGTIIRLSNGRLVVGDGGSQELRYFGPDGEHLLSTGGRGNGPDEFQFLNGPYLLPGDSVGAFDASTNRFTVFTRDGQYIRTLRLDEPGEGYGRPFAVGVTGSGDLVIRGDQSNYSEPGLTRDVSTFFLYSPGGNRGSEITSMPGTELVSLPERNFIQMVEMGRSSQAFVAGNDLYIGVTDVLEFSRYTLPNLHRRITRVNLPARQITTDTRNRMIEHRLQGIEDPNRRIQIRQSVEEATLPPEMPQYQRIRASENGETWVQRYDPSYIDEDRIWWIFGDDGHLKARIAIPRSLTIDQVSEKHLIGHERDDLDVERVVVYEIIR